MHNVILLWYIHELPKKCKAEQIKWKRRNRNDWNEIRQDKKFNILIKNNFFCFCSLSLLLSISLTCLSLCFKIDFLLPMFYFGLYFLFYMWKNEKKSANWLVCFLTLYATPKRNCENMHCIYTYIQYIIALNYTICRVVCFISYSIISLYVCWYYAYILVW